MTRRSLLIVNYRSSALAAEATRTARAASSEPLQVVVVDNSCDAAEAEELRGTADVVIAAERNLGYAAGINLGRRSCEGEVIIVSNPDVRYGEASIDRLIAAGANVAGPALFWDDAHQWHLPPADLHTRGEVAGRVLASRIGWIDERRAARRVRERVAFWSLEPPTPVKALSGAVMAIRAAAFDEVNGFDERFPLYFEENDFLRRVAGPILYVPNARCRHLYNQSAAGSPEAAASYARSESAYLKKWGGAWAKTIERARPPAPLQQEQRGATRDMVAEMVIEASPLPDFETAAGHFTTNARVEVLDDIWNAYRGDVLYMRAVTRQGRVIATWTRARMTS